MACGTYDEFRSGRLELEKKGVKDVLCLARRFTERTQFRGGCGTKPISGNEWAGDGGRGARERAVVGRLSHPGARRRILNMWVEFALTTAR